MRMERAKDAIAFPSFTVEKALYGLIASLALALRLLWLGRWPMGEREASQALAAWQLSQGMTPSSTDYSPLLLSLDSIFFSLFGANDFVARLPLALMGTILALLPYLLRYRLGRRGALVASAILAFSPATLYFSRRLGSEIAVATFALASVCCLFGYLDEGRPTYLHVGVASLALAMSAGPEAYSFPLVLIACSLLIKHQMDQRRVRWPNLAATFAACFALSSTCLLLNPSGLGSAAELLHTWLEGFKLHLGPWHHRLQLLLVYEPLALVFGLVGVAYRSSQRDALGNFLACWVGGALLLLGRGDGELLLALVPLALLAGSAIERLFGAAGGKEGLCLAVAILPLAFASLELAGYSLTGRLNYLASMAIAVGLTAASIVPLRIWFGLGPALRGMGLALLLILSTTTFGTSLNLNYHRACDPHELIAAHPTSPSIFDLLETLERASRHQGGDPHLLAITVHKGVGPVLAWYLRDFPRARFVDQLPSEVSTPAVIAPEDIPVSGDYVGQDFLLRSSWNPGNLTWPERARWLLYRQAKTPVQTERVVLWMRR